MKRINTWIQKYLIFAFPIVLATIGWNIYESDFEIRTTGSTPIKILWEVMSWSLVLWFACLAVFMVLLVIRRETQESTIKLIAGIKERDEREQQITGMAARKSFVSTTALLIFLIFVSCFTLKIAHNPNESIDGKKSTLSLGFSLSGTEMKNVTSPDGKIVFEHRDIPLSKASILLLVLVWQMVTFRVSARKVFTES